MPNIDDLYQTANISNKGTINDIEKYSKIYRGKCIFNSDPLKQGRIKAWIPEMMDGTVNDDEGVWIRPASFTFAGNSEDGIDGADDCGSVIIPPVGSYIYIFFEQGDPSKGRYFAGASVDNSIPTECQNGQEWFNKHVILKTPKGKLLMISDAPDDGGIIIRSTDRSKNKREVKDTPLRSDSIEIAIQDTDKDKYILVNDGNKNYFLINEKDTEITCELNTGTKIFMSKDGMDINVVGDLNINATGSIRINGTMIYLNC